MNVNDLCTEIEKAGGEIEPIKKHCKFQTVFAKNIFEYCKQVRNPSYSMNLGSAGGPAICCEGVPAAIIRWENKKEKYDTMSQKAIYGKKPEPCPHYIKDGEVIGYKIILPEEMGNDQKETI